jgi:hypothetical protein
MVEPGTAAKERRSMDGFRWSHALAAALFGLLVAAAATPTAHACIHITRGLSDYTLDGVRGGLFAPGRLDEQDRWPAQATWNLGEERLVLGDGSFLETR